MTTSALRAAAARVQNMTSELGTTRGARVPLASLRSRLDEASSSAYWAMNADGVLGRSLMMSVGATVTFPLALAGEVRFEARAMLLPHDWRDGRDAVRAIVTVTDTTGHAHRLWSGMLRASDRGRPRGRRADCRIPAGSTSLQLGLEAPGALRPRSVARAIWLEPTITDPAAPPITRPGDSTPPPPPPPTNTPLISVLTPVHDPPLHMLEDTIASVRAQTFTNWELCLADDGSTKPEIIAALERYAATDPRIHLTRRDTAGGISAATNAALETATGQYIALLDHDDTLTPDALQHVADRISAQPDLDMIYTDEDIVLDGHQIWARLKPGWSPEHMAALMYTCHLGVYRRTVAVDVGGFRSRFDGCQDYDFVLRLAERTDRIAHIPRILYHWRAHADSTAGGDQAKPYAYIAQPGAISEHLHRSHINADVQFSQFPGLHRIVHRVDRSTTVDLVLAVTTTTGLEQAAASWLEQPHPAWHIVLAAPPDTLDAATTALTTAGIPATRITTIPTTPDQQPAAALTAAAQAATGEHLLLMQTPAIGLTHDWLTRLLGYSHQPGIGAAGPVILAPDGRITHAGIAIPNGIPLHLHFGSGASAAPPAVYNLSAVSGVLATRRDTYQQLGGLNPAFGDLALIDYCLRATDAGGRIVIVPDTRMRASGPDTNTNDLPAIWRLRRAWATTHTNDPYYNPNYRTDRGDFTLAPFG